MMSDEPIAWRLISNAKGAKWTVQKNFPTEVAKWPGYTVEPCYSADALAAKEAALSEIRAELERVQDEEDKAAREMQAVIQGLRNRATAAEAELERARIIIENCIVQITTLHGVDHVVLTARAFLAARALAPSIQDTPDLGAIG